MHIITHNNEQGALDVEVEEQVASLGRGGSMIVDVVSERDTQWAVLQYRVMLDRTSGELGQMRDSKGTKECRGGRRGAVGEVQTQAPKQGKPWGSADTSPPQNKESHGRLLGERTWPQPR